MSLNSIKDFLQWAVSKFTDTSVAKNDAEILLSHVLQVNRAYLKTWPEKELTHQQEILFQSFVEKRSEGHPVAYLIGEWEFWSLPFYVSDAVLIPRPETELLVEAVLNKIEHISHPRILDLGTGSGILAISIKFERSDADVLAIDNSNAALEIAQKNAKRHQVDIHFLKSHWYSQLEDDNPFDVIVSNPPYIGEQEAHWQQQDCRFEPKSALVADEKGLADIKTIIQQAGHFLKQGTWLIIEHGYQQAEKVQVLFKEANYQMVTTQKDYAQLERFTMGKR